MKGYFQTYRKFTETNNSRRESLGKEKNHKVVIAIYYLFLLIRVAIIYLFAFIFALFVIGIYLRGLLKPPRT
jgi:preprotein translocase subunit SecF